MEIHLFGSTSLTGKSFVKNAIFSRFNYKIISYSRSDTKDKIIDFNNLENNPKETVFSSSSILVSFAPIWLFSKYLSFLNRFHAEKFESIGKIIVCSSSSVISKRFAWNKFDQLLVDKIRNSEIEISKISKEHKISLTIIRPSMIYGEIENNKDKNISRILFLLRLLPLIPIPKRTGQRQPIHIDQLSKVVLKYIQDFNDNPSNALLYESILLGGDLAISYEKVIYLLQDSLNKGDKGKRCKILLIPNRLFFTFLLPVLWFSPKFYEAIYRICSNLSGYKSSYEILKTTPSDFPMKPYSD